MQNYRKILVAVELADETDRYLIDKAKFFTKHGAELYLIHAVEHLNAYGSAQAYPAITDLEYQISEEHQKMLITLAEHLGVDSGHRFIEIGAPSSIVASKAEELGADLVIVGSHARHGIASLLGSTADALLHTISCDILAVRLPDLT